MKHTTQAQRFLDSAKMKNPTHYACELIEQAESDNLELDQDWVNESTNVLFEDGSKIVVCGSSAEAT